ncbi:hypothetical protein OY671_009668, partial [Metschnikowia pulcherrima]
WGTKQPTFDPKTGDRGERDNSPADHFPMVYYAGQGSPPDSSSITKARHGGGAYVDSSSTGYQDQPAESLKKFPDAKTPEGSHYNPYFANSNSAMPAPSTGDGQVTYSDGTPATVDQMSKDVSAFSIWTAEPKSDKRKQTGWAVSGFSSAATVSAYSSKKQVWSNVGGH